MSGETPNRPSILAFGPGLWNWPSISGSPRYHLWSLASRGWRIIYVNPPRQFHPRSRFWHAPDRQFGVLSAGQAPPFAHRFVHNRSLGEAWRRITSAVLVRKALRACRLLRFEPDAYWFGAPWHGSIARLLPPGPIRLAHVYDELSLSPILRPRQQRLLWDWEQQLLEKCDLVCCSSLPQKKRRDGIAPRVILLENAVEDQFLEGYEVAPMGDRLRRLIARLEKVPRPRFVYGGVADLRLDPACFQHLLNTFSEAHLVFLGTHEPSFDSSFAQKARQSGRVHFTGRVPYHAYPSLYSLSDVLLIAHRKMSFTEAMYPEKLMEYLASGRPVVSVDLPEVDRIAVACEDPRLIRTASTPGEFCRLVGEALEEDESLPAKRIDVARRNTWSVRAERLEEELLRLIGPVPGDP